MSMPHTLIHRFNAIKTSGGLCAEICRKVIKFLWKDKEHRRAKIILKKTNQIRGPTLFAFKMHYKAIVPRQDQLDIGI